jgi:hypothetical protein
MDLFYNNKLIVSENIVLHFGEVIWLGGEKVQITSLTKSRQPPELFVE